MRSGQKFERPSKNHSASFLIHNLELWPILLTVSYEVIEKETRDFCPSPCFPLCNFFLWPRFQNWSCEFRKWLGNERLKVYTVTSEKRVKVTSLMIP